MTVMRAELAFRLERTSEFQLNMTQKVHFSFLSKNKKQGVFFFIYFFRSTEIVDCHHNSMYFLKTSLVFLVHSNLPDFSSSTVGSGRLYNLEVPVKWGLSNIIFLGAFRGLLFTVTSF